MDIMKGFDGRQKECLFKLNSKGWANISRPTFLCCTYTYKYVYNTYNTYIDIN